jgi:hypothetical protein
VDLDSALRSLTVCTPPPPPTPTPPPSPITLLNTRRLLCLAFRNCGLTSMRRCFAILPQLRNQSPLCSNGLCAGRLDPYAINIMPSVLSSTDS